MQSGLPKLARRLAADRRGVSGLVTALAATALLGFAGLAIDVIMWEVNLRTMQGAADQAALAGATAYRNASQTTALGVNATAVNAAYATAIRSGYPADAVSVTAFNNGSTCTNNGCLQVTITQAQPRYFTGIFLQQAPTASAGAVGTCNGCGNGAFNFPSNGGSPCVMALEASGRGVVTATGNPTLTLNACYLYNNSPDTNATIVNGQGVIQGTESQAFLAQPNVPSGSILVPVVTSSSPAPDPYAGLTPPTVSLPCQNLPVPPINVPSGTYCGGNKFQNKVITFADGAIIVITGGLDLHSGVTSLTGTNVTLYVQSDGSNAQASTINATTTINITSPGGGSPTGPYAGIALWFAGASPVTYAGVNGATYKGAIYAPDAEVTYTGNIGSGSTCVRLIASSITLDGGADATFDNSGCPSVVGPARVASGVSGTTPYTGAPMLIQ